MPRWTLRGWNSSDLQFHGAVSVLSTLEAPETVLWVQLELAVNLVCEPKEWRVAEVVSAKWKERSNSGLALRTTSAVTGSSNRGSPETAWMKTIKVGKQLFKNHMALASGTTGTLGSLLLAPRATSTSSTNQLGHLA